MQDTDLSDVRVTRLRAAQAALFLAGWLVKVNLARFTEMASSLAKPLADEQLKRIAAYVSPRIAGLLALAVGGKLPVTAIAALNAGRCGTGRLDGPRGQRQGVDPPGGA